MRHSYSSYSTYKQCAAKYNFSYNLKLPRAPKDPNSPMARGTEVHDSCEEFFLGKQEYLHPDIHSQYGQWMFNLRQDYVCKPELKWGITDQWEECEFDDPDVWVRGFFDLFLEEKPKVKTDEVDIYEWKTGKVYDEHIDQRFLYGTIALVLFPRYNRVTVRGVYFDQKNGDDHDEYERENLPFMKQEWSKRFIRIENENVWAPNPTFLCRYCDFSKQNGGPCQF